MEAIKIKNYEREHGAGTFVPFHHLSDEEAKRVLRLLKCCLGLAMSLPAKEVVKAIRDKSIVAQDVNAQSNDFSLEQVLNKLDLKRSSIVYLNWYRFDKIDEFRIRDLLRIFGCNRLPSHPQA